MGLMNCLLAVLLSRNTGSKYNVCNAITRCRKDSRSGFLGDRDAPGQAVVCALDALIGPLEDQFVFDMLDVLDSGGLSDQAVF